jgi:hypothetical protein
MPVRLTARAIHERLSRIASELERALAELEVLEASMEPSAERRGRKTKYQFTEAQKNAVRRRLKLGLSRREIARRMKIPASTFNHLVIRDKLAP